MGFDPTTDNSEDTPPSAHPNATDQDYFVSWNNKQAQDYSAADGNYSYGPVQRVDLLNQGITSYLATGAKFTRAALVQVMEQAAVTDLRGKEVLPLLLQVINSQPVTDPAQQALVSELSTWLQDGATIVPTSSGATTFQNSAAIQLMDAWWPLLVHAEFEPGMGSNLFTTLSNDMQVNESPSAGSRSPAAAPPPTRPSRTRVRPSSTAGGGMSARTCAACSARVCRTRCRARTAATAPGWRPAAPRCSTR
ncbi:penicillin acylase family protein [Streptacidiphilus sp. 4-A2]|nr:penicillin acylase family protein [Streptacidiphilus sp. 4-A2]